MGKTFLLEQIKQLIGKDIRIQNIDLTVLPSPRLQLFEIEIKNVSGQLEYFSTQFLDVEILLLPLFLRTIVVERLILEQPNLTVRLIEKEVAPTAPSPESGETPSIGPSFVFNELAIRGGKVNLRKESKLKATRALRIEDLLITLSPQDSASYATLQASAKISNPQSGDATFVVSGNFIQQPSGNTTQIPHRNNSLPLEFTGHAEISNFDMVLIKEFLEQEPAPEKFQVVANLKGQLTLFPEKSGLTLVYSDLEGTLENIPIRGKGSLSGLLGKETTFYSSLSSSPISLRALESVLPAMLVSSDILQNIEKTLQELEIDGKVEVIHSIIAGSTADNISISMVKEVRISQGRLLLNRNSPPITNIEGTVIWDNGKLRLHNFSGKFGATRILDARGDIQFRKSGPWANLQAASHVDFQDLLTTWRAFAFPQTLPALLEHIQGTGDVTVKVHGPLQTPKDLVFEAVQLQDCKIVLSENLPPIRDISGTVRVGRNRLNFSDFKARYGSSTLLNAAGIVDLRGKGPWAQVEADTVLNVQDIKLLTAHLAPAIHMPKTLEMLEGDGNLSVGLEGPLDDFEKIVVEKARLEKGRLKIHPTLPYVQPVVGTATYKNGILRLSNFNAEFGSSQIRETSAIIDFRGEEPAMGLALQSNVMANDVMDIIVHTETLPETLQSLRDLKEVTGKALLKAKLHWPLKHPEELSVLAGEVHIEDIGFQTPQLSDPIEQITGRLLLSKDTLSISNLSGRMGRSLASLSGRLAWGKGSLFHDVVFQANVDSADFKKIQPGILPESLQGALQLNGVVFGQKDTPRYRIEADLQGIDLNIPNVIHKPRGMPASLKAHGKLQDTKIIILDRAEFHLPHFALSGKGTFDIRDPFALTASLKSAPVSLASLPEDMLFGIKKFQSGDLTLSLDVEGTGTDWRGWQIIGSTQLTKVITGKDAPDDPIHQLSVDASLNQDQGKLSFFMEAIPIKNILPVLGINEFPVEGTVWGNGQLEGILAPDQDLTPTLHGNLHLLFRNGIVHGGHALPKILSLMNFPSLIAGDVKWDQNNIPYDSISADYKVEKGILRTENYVLRSPIVILSAAGKYDLPADQIDFVVVASPLGSYRNLVEGIPLATSLFGENLLAVSFEAKGPLKDPKVTPLPIQSMGVGTKHLFDVSTEVLKGAVTLPQKAWESIPTKQ